MATSQTSGLGPHVPRVDPKWIRNRSDELAVEQGCWFDENAGQFVCDFIEEFCRQSKGRWAGQPLTLLDWQRDFLMRLFGWMMPNGKRRFRRAYLEVAKKNGKSTLLSALSIFLLLCTLEGAPEVHLNACDKEQAGIIFDEAVRMVESSPELAKRLEVIKSDKRIIHPKGNGKIQANSADVNKQDGLNPSTIIFDELHRQKTRAMWDVFEYAAVARDEPLTISITTAGEEEAGVWFEQREYSEKVNAGVIPDISHLGVIYRALETDNLDDPATWAKANPSLGETIRLEDFKREHAEAKAVPTKWNNFRRLRLNIVSRAAAKFIDLAQWDQCQGPHVHPRGESAYGGLDLSETDDLSALAILIGDPELFDVRMWFWLPENNIVELERKHQVPYRTWADQGLITLTPGNVIDYKFIRRQINEVAGDWALNKLLIDPYNAVKLSIELKEEDGLPVEQLRQGFLSLNGPTKELRRLVRGGRLRHAGHPILRWHASNAIAVEDDAGGLKLSKAKSKKKIDGMSALVNAVACATSGDPDESSSVYDTRGIITI
jgi:phage terminase large subunit-like protein